MEVQEIPRPRNRAPDVNVKELADVRRLAEVIVAARRTLPPRRPHIDEQTERVRNALRHLDQLHRDSENLAVQGPLLRAFEVIYTPHRPSLLTPDTQAWAYLCDAAVQFKELHDLTLRLKEET
ncbi:hypothetical protein ABZ649_04595 [Streptomyces albidoflavus]|uniref:hypothetical protein n=1 Tax=Streptomyces albidoflavus TaxID=1886 RepID=UPI0033DE105E